MTKRGPLAFKEKIVSKKGSSENASVQIINLTNVYEFVRQNPHARKHFSFSSFYDYNHVTILLLGATVKGL